MCRLLLDWGAKLDPVDKWKYTAQHDATRQGHFSVVKLLVERGADVRVKNEDGETARDIARRFRHSDVVDWLE
jgi:ankyrin repeat protein